jgi:hypothetical protein
MIDSISFFLLGRHSFSGVQYKRGVGFLGPIRFQRISDYHGTIISCSLPRLITGENISTLNRQTVKEAVFRLEDMIGINLREIELFSIETGASFIMNQWPGRYVQLLGDHPRYRRRPFIDPTYGLTGILYKTKKSNFSFQAYNKIIRMESLKEEIPPLFKESHVLRLEHKIKTRNGIKMRFGSDLTPHDLYYPDTYQTLKKFFWKFYLDIKKTGQTVFFERSGGKLTPAKFSRLLAQQHYYSCPDNCRILLAEERAMGNLDKDSWKKIKKDYGITRSKDYKRNSFNNELIEELNAKVWARVKTG